MNEWKEAVFFFWIIGLLQFWGHSSAQPCIICLIFLLQQLELIQHRNIHSQRCWHSDHRCTLSSCGRNNEIQPIFNKACFRYSSFYKTPRVWKGKILLIILKKVCWSIFSFQNMIECSLKEALKSLHVYFFYF